ncbi:MAG: endolytic transglycosylase MltG [bacterium]
MKTEVERYDKKFPKSDKNLEVKVTKRKGVYFYQNKFFIYPFIGIVVIFFALLSYANFASRPVSQNREDFVYFEVKKGETKNKIAQSLRKKKLIRSSLAFLVSAYTNGDSLQAGHYKISPAMSTNEIIKKIKSGDVDAFTITIPEGFRVLQIAKKLNEIGKIDIDKFIASALGTEGTLFPDTYVVAYGLEEAKIVKMFKDNFIARTSDLRLSEEDLIIASIVEREAITDKERSKIAAVYKNRVENNMLLQADPTVRYGIDTQTYLKKKNLDFDFWQPITRQDINSLISQFNSYVQKGLSPAPICNPGIKSIEAVLQPEKDFDYFYFFHDESKQIHFSKTYQEHLENIQKFGV